MGQNHPSIAAPHNAARNRTLASSRTTHANAFMPFLARDAAMKPRAGGDFVPLSTPTVEDDVESGERRTESAACSTRTSCFPPSSLFSSHASRLDRSIPRWNQLVCAIVVVVACAMVSVSLASFDDTFAERYARLVREPSIPGQTSTSSHRSADDRLETSRINATVMATSIVSTPLPVNDSETRRELDIVVSVYDEVPQTLFKHLEGCCPKRACRVWLYSAFEKGKSVRSHSLPKQEQVGLGIEGWMNVSTPFEKHVLRVNNTWTGTEATGYLTYVHQLYDDLADKLAFVHGHVSSWHSENICDIIRRGVAKADTAMVGDSVYVNINKPFPLRCLSRSGTSGLYATEELRAKVYENWAKWTGEAETPSRLTWECCAQFVTTRQSLRARGRAFWKHTYEAMYSFPNDTIPWEYLWPTLVSPSFSASRGNC